MERVTQHSGAWCTREIKLLPAFYTKYDDLWPCGYRYSDLFLYYVVSYVKFGTCIITGEPVFGSGVGRQLGLGVLVRPSYQVVYSHNKFDTPSLYWKLYFCSVWRPLGVSFLIIYSSCVYLLRILYFCRGVNVVAIKVISPHLLLHNMCSTWCGADAPEKKMDTSLLH